MKRSPHTHTLSWKTGFLIVLLLLAGCAPLLDDEAAWVLDDMANAVSAGQSGLFLIDGLADRPIKLDSYTAWRAIRAILAQRKEPSEGGQ